MKEDGVLRMSSLNPLYDPFDLPVSEVRELEICAYISSEMPEATASVSHWPTP